MISRRRPDLPGLPQGDSAPAKSPASIASWASSAARPRAWAGISPAAAARIGLRLGAGETIHRLAIPMTITVGRLRTPELLGDHLLLVGVDLCQQKGALVLVGDFSSSGISTLQGSHQSAQKSTTTGRLWDSSMSS